VNRTVTSRISAALIMGIILCSYVHHYYLWWNHRGREAFLAHQAQRFDRFMAAPHASLGLLFAAILVTAVGAGMYELLALGILTTLKAFAGKST
jgi:hypothetical protein